MATTFLVAKTLLEDTTSTVKRELVRYTSSKNDTSNSRTNIILNRTYSLA